VSFDRLSLEERLCRYSFAYILVDVLHPGEGSDFPGIEGSVAAGACDAGYHDRESFRPVKICLGSIPPGFDVCVKPLFPFKFDQVPTPK